MGKYKVEKVLSKRQGGFIQPGEIVELDDETAAPLLAKNALSLHEVKRTYKRRTKKKED